MRPKLPKTDIYWASMYTDMILELLGYQKHHIMVTQYHYLVTIQDGRHMHCANFNNIIKLPQVDLESLNSVSTNEFVGPRKSMYTIVLRLDGYLTKIQDGRQICVLSNLKQYPNFVPSRHKWKISGSKIMFGESTK